MEANTILHPGRNCWRMEHAGRLAFLVDGDAYFRAVRAALFQARRSIFILAWDIDSRVRLVRGPAEDGLPAALGPFLNALAAARPGLQVHVLAWDFAMIYALEREWLPVYKLGWRTHRRLHFRLDDKHPAGASQHQKLVVVDDRVAFVGGFDLTKRRWDTPEHRPDEPGRIDPDGTRYPPFHDVAMAVDGAAAAALGELARERWMRAGGKSVSAPDETADTHDPWPAHVGTDLRNTSVAIARTVPRYNGQPEVREVERLFLDAIAAAKHLLYIENQYFTAKAVADALGKRLRQRDGPEVVLVLPYRSSGWLEQYTMDALRNRLLEQLRKADLYQRLQVLYPYRQGLGGAYIYEHAKVFVADERLLLVGSANLSNRSMGLDTECDLAIEGHGESQRNAIAALRNRLVAEHVGALPEDVAAALARERSFAAALEVMGNKTRQLRPVPFESLPFRDQWVAEAALYDPERPLDPKRLAQQFLPREQWQHAGRRLLALAAVLGTLLAFAFSWQFTPIREWLSIESFIRMEGALRGATGAALAAIGAYLAGGLLILPLTVLIAITIWLFGPLPGLFYAMGGATLSAALTYVIGRLLGRHRIRLLISRRLNRLSWRMAHRGLVAVISMRLLPVAPFSVVNLMAGASNIPLGRFILGTIIGIAPGILAIALFVDRLIAMLRTPNLANLALLTTVVLAVALAGIAIKRWLLPGLAPSPRSRAQAL